MTPRIVYIGQEVSVTASFFSEGVPLMPNDPNLYPSFVVRDIHQDLVVAGTGTFNAQDNLYHADFTIPDTSVLSDEENKYVIDWDLVTNNGLTYKLTEYFDVVNPSYNLTTTKEIQKIGFSFTKTALTIPLPGSATSINFKLYNQADQVIHTSEPVPAGMYSEYYIYKNVIQAGTMSAGNSYNAVWTFVLGNEESVYYQKLTCIDFFTMSRISDLRMMLDKVMKDIDLYVGYRDSDLAFYLRQGLGLINMISPLTTWGHEVFINGEVPEYALLEAAYYVALRAQYLAEGDSAFDYSGQPVTLTVDRTQYIEAEIGRSDEWLKGEFKEFKKQWKNRRHGFQLGLQWPNVSNRVGGYYPRQLHSEGISSRLIFNR